MIWKVNNFVYFSFSVQAATSAIDEEAELLLVQNIIEYLKDESDEQNVYRAVVAIGTLVRQDDVRRHSVSK